MVSQLPVEVCESKLSLPIEAPVTPVSQLQFRQSGVASESPLEVSVSQTRVLALDVTL